MSDRENWYYIGLDIGTDSVGWAVTDKNFNIVRKNGKHLWGIRLFPEAKTAVDRRAARTARKRTQRRRARILALRELIGHYITAGDSEFFNRLDNSFAFKWEDQEKRKRVKKSILFNDPNYTDKDFFKKFPTIYHLRKYLMETKEKPDIREFYLGLHHIIKYRGNFLDTSSSSEDSNMSLSDVIESFSTIDASLREIYGSDSEEQDVDRPIPQFGVDGEKAKKILDVFKKFGGITNTYENLLAALNLDNKGDPVLLNLIGLISGKSVDYKKIFGESEDLPDELKKLKLSDFEDKIDPHLSALDDDEQAVILECRNLYAAHELTRIIGEHKCISDAMIGRYDSHKKQLCELKEFVKENYDKKVYARIFGNPLVKEINADTNKEEEKKLSNYSRYIGSAKDKEGVKLKDWDDQNGKGGHCSRDDFYKFLKKELAIDSIKGKAEGDLSGKEIFLLSIKDEMDNNTYLLRQNDPANGVIKKQLNEHELRAILTNMERFFPWLKEKDADGKSLSEKIIDTFNFKIPYYIGPLDNNSNNKNSWARETESWKTKGDQKIRPWNWDKFVDKDVANKKFIERMTSNCSYILSAKTLPKYSLLYSEYSVLNEINKIVIQDKGGNVSYLTQEQKDAVIDLYKAKGKPGIKEIKNTISGLLGCSDFKLLTSGSSSVDLEDLNSFYLQANMNSWRDMKDILGSQFKFEIAEDIIRLITLTEDRSLLRDSLRKYSRIHLTNKQIDSLCKLRYKGWGKFSEELLNGITNSRADGNGEIIEGEITIIDAMRKVYVVDGNPRSYNFMEVLNSDRFDFLETIERINHVSSGKYDSLEDYIQTQYISPAMKRAVIQSVKIVEECEKIIGCTPRSIFIESTREAKKQKKGKGKNGNLKNRKTVLDELYKSAAKTAKEYEADRQSSQEKLSNFSGKITEKIYLYFLQLGRDVYTGDEINFTDLLENNNSYNVDHIIPRSKISDDSLDNKVLVSQEKNEAKKDIYPIPSGIIEKKGRDIIEALHRMKLMSTTKYERLIRSENKELTVDELTGFANRQLTVTSQAVKAVRDVLQWNYDHDRRYAGFGDDQKPELVFPKAELTSMFRRKFDIVKCREINDLHHAHDAYLNIVVGECIKSFYNMKWKQEKISTDEIKKLFDDKANLSNTEYTPQSTALSKAFSGHIWSRFESSRCDWNAHVEGSDKKSTIQAVKANLSRHDVLYTEMLIERNGGLYDANPLSPRKIKGDPIDYTSIKNPTNDGSRFYEMRDVTKYGYYDNPSIAFFSLVSYKEKSKKKEKTIHYLFPVRADVRSRFHSANSLGSYITKVLESQGYTDVKVIKPIIYINSLISFEPTVVTKKGTDTYVRITGKAGSRLLFNLSLQPYYPDDLAHYCKLISRYQELIRKKSSEAAADLLWSDDNEPCEDHSKINRADNIRLYRFLTKQFSKPMYSAIQQIVSLAALLSDKEDAFSNALSLEKQIAVLYGLIQGAETKGIRPDLRAIGGSEHSLAFTSNLTLAPGTTFWSESVTGFFRKKEFKVPR